MFEAMSPWSEVDAAPPQGISRRLDRLDGKRIGLFTNNKVAAAGIQNALERRLKERFPDATLSYFYRAINLEVVETPGKAAFEKWVSENDAVILYVAD
jgi:hypothetical protein